MKDLHRITKGIFLKAASNVLVLLLGLAVSVFLNRHYGKLNYGLLVLVFTVMNFCWSFSDLGANRTINRYIPIAITGGRKEEVRSLMNTAFIFQISGTLFFATLMYLSAHYIAVSLFRQDSFVNLVRLGALMLIGTTLIEFVSQFYQAFQDWFRDSLLNVIYPALYLLLIIIGALFLNSSINGIFYANALAAGFTILLALVILPKRIKSLLSGKKMVFSDYLNNSKKIFNFGTPLLLNDLSFFLLTWFDKALMGRFRPLEELTFYYIAYMFLNGIVTLFKTLVTVFMPYVSGFANTSEEKIKEKFELMFRWFLHITILISVGAFFLVEPLISKLYGDDYRPAILAFRMLLLLFIGRGLANLPNIFLTNVYGQAKQMVGIITILVIANITFNFLLVPKYGYIGAILAATLAYGIYWIGVFFIKIIRNKIPFMTIFKTLGSIVLISLLYFLLLKVGIRASYVYAFMLPIFYLLLLRLFNEITKRDIKIAKEIINTLLKIKNPKIGPQII